MPERDDAQRIQDLQRKIRRGEVDEGVRRILVKLEAARREILAEVADTDWDAFMLPRLTANIDRQLDHWRDLALQDLTADQAGLWNLGGKSVLGTMTEIGISLALPELPTSLLSAMQNKAGQRIGGLVQSAKDRIDKLISTALLTGQSREETIQALGRALELGDASGKPEGLFASIANRARFIYRQEVGAVYATAQDLRREQVTRYAPGLKKVWVHDGHPHLPRVDHIAMHGQERDQDEPFLNPVTREELMFPRDPAADISETAGCTCDVFLWRPEYGDKLAFIGPATRGNASTSTMRRVRHAEAYS